MSSQFPETLSRRVGFLLAQAHMRLRADADEALARVGLDMKSFASLATLTSDGPISQRRLSERIRMDPATMVDVIDGLEESGHIVRRRNPADRREYALELTAKGRSLYARANQALVEAEKGGVTGLSAAELTKLNELLLKLNREPALTKR